MYKDFFFIFFFGYNLRFPRKKAKLEIDQLNFWWSYGYIASGSFLINPQQLAKKISLIQFCHMCLKYRLTRVFFLSKLFSFHILNRRNFKVT